LKDVILPSVQNILTVKNVSNLQVTETEFKKFQGCFVLGNIKTEYISIRKSQVCFSFQC